MSRVPDISPAQGGASLMMAWRLKGRRVLVVGGGTVGAGRVLSALEADGIVTVVSPSLGAQLRARHARGEFTWIARTFEPSDLDDVDMVLSCVDDPVASLEVATLARERRIPANIADKPDLCDFWFASMHRDGPLQIAVSTNGHGPAISSRLRKQIAASMPAGIGDALRRFQVLRTRIKAVPDMASKHRMSWLGTLGRSWPIPRLATLSDADIDTLVADYTSGNEPPPPERGRRSGPRGTVTLVGAGPGHPGLLTDAARAALEGADLALADRLVAPEILDLVQGELRIARKFPGRADQAQAELDAQVLAAVDAGKSVVRLKCGDPFVFGRGGEEIERYRTHGIEAAVIPGVTSAFSAPLAAGIPVTMRGLADKVLVATAQGKGGTTPTLPSYDADTTVVFLMGVGRLATVADGLIAAGWPADWPVGIVERGFRPGQQVVVGTLSTIAARAADAEVAAPATIVVGRTVTVAAAWKSASVVDVGERANVLVG